MRARTLILVPLTLAVTVGGLVWGGRNAYISVRNRAPVELTCADYLAHPPDAEWVRLTHCDVDLDHVGVEQTTRERKDAPAGAYTSSPEITSVYIPLRAEHALHSAPALLVLHSDHYALREVGTGHASEAEFQQAEELLAQPIEGVVELSVERSARSKAELRELNLRLATDFAVLDHRATPRPLLLSLGVFALGLGGLGLCVRRVRRWFRKGSPRVPKATALT